MYAIPSRKYTLLVVDLPLIVLGLVLVSHRGWAWVDVAAD